MEGYLVATRGVAPERIVTVDGAIASCLTQELWIVPPGTTPKPKAAASFSSYQPFVYKFDEHSYGHVDPEGLYYWRDSLDDLLEGFALELQKNPKSTGYLIAYKPTNPDGSRAAQRQLQSEQNFLITHFGIKPGRIKTIEGGYRGGRIMELWIAQGKGAAPIITSYRYSPGRRRR